MGVLGDKIQERSPEAVSHWIAFEKLNIQACSLQSKLEKEAIRMETKENKRDCARKK